MQLNTNYTVYFLPTQSYNFFFEYNLNIFRKKSLQLKLFRKNSDSIIFVPRKKSNSVYTEIIGNHNIIIKRKNKAHYYHTIIIELQLYNKKSGTL